jgi:hypothetical protein
VIVAFENTFLHGLSAEHTHKNSMHSQNPPSESLANGPLSGIRVVEYGVFHAGRGRDTGRRGYKNETGQGDPERF